MDLSHISNQPAKRMVAVAGGEDTTPGAIPVQKVILLTDVEGELVNFIEHQNSVISDLEDRVAALES